MDHRTEALTMQKKLVRHGNSLALVIDKPILELLGADAETLFEITTDGQALVLSPARSDARREAFRTALERINEDFSDDLHRLAE
jgi:antitoxin component of MazEF toxin-antitoxin module